MPNSGRCAPAYLFAGLYVRSVAAIVISVVQFRSRATLNADSGCVLRPVRSWRLRADHPVLRTYLSDDPASSRRAMPPPFECQDQRLYNSTWPPLMMIQLGKCLRAARVRAGRVVRRVGHQVDWDGSAENVGHLGQDGMAFRTEHGNEPFGYGQEMPC